MTIADSMMTEFKVVASMSGGIYPSQPASGFSVDNIIPSPPTGLAVLDINLNGITLSWDLSPDEDFQYFVLEKSLDSEFLEFDVVETADTIYVDAGFALYETNYYRLLAYDISGNVSDYSDILWVDALSIDNKPLPQSFSLEQNFPNPFNPVTKIRYGIPQDAMVKIAIYDIIGRKIKVLVNDYQSAGFRSVKWNGTNGFGDPVSAGMYIYTIQVVMIYNNLRRC